METRGKYTREEIFSQPEAWRQAIAVLNERSAEIQEFAQPRKQVHVIFTGCGSTYYLSCAAAALMQEVTGLPARGLPASELWLSPRSSYSEFERSILIAVSRSGETSETLEACELFKRKNGSRLITLVCDPHSSLAKMGSLNLVFPSGMESSVAQTRAFSTLYLGVTGLILLWSGKMGKFDQLGLLPAAGERVLSRYTQTAKKYGAEMEFDRFYYLGSAGRYGLARELNLKMKEMSLTHSESFHFLEFRHGPKAMVDPHTLVVGLVSQTNAVYENAVLRDVTELGGEVISMGEKDANIEFNSGVQEVLRNILYLPFGQMLAYERSIAKGLDPDRPVNLDPVVRLANAP